MSAPDRSFEQFASRGFLRALFGVLVTLLAWFGPWSWPAWPAMAVLEVAFSPARPFVALSHDARAAIVVLVIITNVSTWALLAWAIEIARIRVRRGAPDTPAPPA